MSSFVVREATPDDLPEIGGLWRELQQANALHEPRLTPNATATTWFLSYMEDQLLQEQCIVYVAESKGLVVGYTFGQILRRPTLQSGDCGYIADLCVREGFRSQGIGRRLVESLRSWFLSRNIQAIEVQVVRANPASQTFWRKMGFQDFLRTLRKDL